MKLHYKGAYDLNPESLPHGEHQPGAVPFREAKDSKTLSILANALSLVIMLLLAIPAFFRCREYLPASPLQLSLGCLASLVIIFPHELLHAVCFREDVYLYTNWKQGMLFVLGPETMSKGRFIIPKGGVRKFTPPFPCAPSTAIIRGTSEQIVYGREAYGSAAQLRPRIFCAVSAVSETGNTPPASRL